MRKLSAILLIGCLSMLFAEVFSGASQAWFASAIGLVITFPLYLGHILFFLWLALRLGRTSIKELYLFGMLFALYESWITKVLWAGYFDQSAPLAGTVAGVGISEFVILVFFWHPVMSFIVPILVYEILTGRIVQHHAWILKKSAKKTRLIILSLVMFSGFIAMGNKYDTISANLSLIGSMLIISGLYFIAKRVDLTAFRFGKLGAGVVTIYLVALYVVTFFTLLPERLPQSPIPYIAILVFYILFIYLIRKINKTEGGLLPLDADHYHIRDLIKFCLILIVSVNVSVLIPEISAVMLVVSYILFSLLGIFLFASVIRKVFNERSPYAKIA